MAGWDTGNAAEQEAHAALRLRRKRRRRVFNGHAPGDFTIGAYNGKPPFAPVIVIGPADPPDDQGGSLPGSH